MSDVIGKVGITLYNAQGEVLRSGEIDLETFEELSREDARAGKDPAAFLYAILLEQMAEEQGG